MDKEDKETFLEMFDCAINALDDEDLTKEEQTEIRERWIRVLRRLLPQESLLVGAPSPSES